MQRNRVVTELDCCEMGSGILGSLSGNNSVKKLTIGANTIELGEKEMRSLAHALQGNMGIEHVAFRFEERMSDETWILLFRSLTTHPRIKLVSVHKIDFRRPRPLSAESKTTSLNAVIQMLQHNTVVRTIEVPDAYNDEEVYQNSILPRLEMNCTYFEVQRQAVKRADPSIRPQLLGRALFVVRYNPELVFLFLSENVPAFVRTDKDPIILIS
jgi:hypothetical protein